MLVEFTISEVTMSIRFNIINSTLQNLTLANYHPAGGWAPPPPNIIPAHSVPDDFTYAGTAGRLVIAYQGAGGPYNVLVLPTAGAPTVHTTNNVQATVTALGGGNYRITLNYEMAALNALSSKRDSQTAANLLATQYGINITMEGDTVDKLQQGNYYLYGFKGVQTTLKNGVPVVWFQTQTYSALTKISWEEEYQAYTALAGSIPKGQIKASAAYDITLGQTLDVTGTAGTGTVVQGGTAGAISILNQTADYKEFTCGISQMQNSGDTPTATPLCAFPLYGTGLDVMAPIELVLLMFSTQQVDTGMVIYKAYSQGVLVNLTGVTERNLKFDINKGWSWGGAAWAQTVPANADLAPLLIEKSDSLSRRVLAALNIAPRADLPEPEARTPQTVAGNGVREAVSDRA